MFLKEGHLISKWRLFSFKVYLMSNPLGDDVKNVGLYVYCIQRDDFLSASLISCTHLPTTVELKN